MGPLGVTPPPSPSEERLESWKEIAAYLKKSVRTVQDWEKKEGLPVHRRQHDKLGTVYAYRAELDAWWRNGHARLEAEEVEEAKETGTKRKPWVMAGAVAALVVVAASAVYWWPRAPVLPFAERDWVLIAQFENQTREDVFNGTLEHALERELSNSRFVNVVPRERVNDTLLLMRRPLDTPISAAVGREVCLRDGGIRALLTGRVEKLDSTYLLSVALVNPSSGVTVRSFSEEAAGQKEVVPALRSLSGQVRAALGEALPEIQKSEQALEKVTTPSLRALQLFSQGRALLEPPSPQNQWPAALEFFEKAVAEDPEFASAHVWLAYAYVNVKRQEEGRPHFQGAFELADSTTDAERYFIVGSYYWQHSKDLPKAAQAFEALLQIYPDHLWATHKLRVICMEMGERGKELTFLIRLADLRPNDFLSNAHAAQRLVQYEDDSPRAKRYHERALALLTPEMAQSWPVAAWVETYPASEHFSKGEVAQALAVLARVEKRLGSPFQNDWARDGYVYRIGGGYETAGKLKKAEEVYAYFKKDVDRYYFTSWVDYHRGDWKAFREHLKLAVGRSNYGPVDVGHFARAGLLPEARAAIAVIEKKQHTTEGRLALARGYVAQAEGRTSEAILLFEKARQESNPERQWVRAFATAALADIHEKQGDSHQAIALREWVRGQRAAAGLGWMESQMHLAKLYRKVGHQREAEEIEDELRKLLAYADADHVIARQLGQPHQAALSQPSR